MPQRKPVGKKPKSPKFMSHEFIIQNHGDIVSCIAMLIVLGLLPQMTAPLASLFIVMQYSLPLPEGVTPGPETVVYYTNGMLDLFAIFFYTLVAVVIHAILQDYVFDKLARRLGISKLRMKSFNEAGHLLFFTLSSFLWGLQILIRDEGFSGITSLWGNYPEDHAAITFRFKFFYIVQLSYWLHTLPELYFQRVKDKDWSRYIQQAAVYVSCIGAAYAFNFGRLMLVLLTVHYFLETARLVVSISGMLSFSRYEKIGSSVHSHLVVPLRLASLTLTFVTFQFGLAQSPAQGLDAATGNYNTPVIRIGCMSMALAVQGWLLWGFLAAQMASRRREKETSITKTAKGMAASHSDEDVSMLPEVDQNTRRRR